MPGPQALTAAQQRTLYALASTLIHDVPPSVLRRETTVADEVLAALAAETADGENAPFAAALHDMFVRRLPRAAVKRICVVLDMLNSTAGCLLLTYSPTAFHQQPIAAREKAYRAWLDPAVFHLFPPIRAFALGIKGIVCASWLRGCKHTIYPAIEYHDRVGSEHPHDASASDDGEQDGFYRFSFEEFRDGPAELRCDVVVVGSGCGGAVVAAHFAQKGYDVVVVEKGKWVPTDQLPLSETDAQDELFENGMMVSTDDGAMPILAASTFGGGGVINWGASLQTQSYVREEWATKHNLPFFLSGDFQACLDEVCNRMGVSGENIRHNYRNQTLMEGARKLGYRYITVPQNSTHAHQCGHCHNGCGGAVGARKMGTTQTYLPDAARAGARFVQTFHCDQVLFEDETKTVALGVVGRWGEENVPVTIRARQVVVSAGALHSPALLLRSGLTNPNIGANLHLHPTHGTIGLFSHKIPPMTGSPLTSAVTELESLDHAGHGPKLECCTMTPTITLSNLPWLSGQSFKSTLLAYPRMAHMIAIQRDARPGRVHLCPTTGAPRVSYTPSADDRAALLRGALALAKILYLQGADVIIPNIHGLAPFERNARRAEAADAFADEELGYETMEDDADAETVELDLPGVLDPLFARWCEDLEALGLPAAAAPLGSAHQMASCAMSGRRAAGVCDYKGRVKGVRALWVADASALPSASAVNPMVTTMAVARWIAGHVAEALAQGVAPGKDAAKGKVRGKWKGWGI